MKLRLLFLAALCATTGACATDVDDDEEVDESEDALRNTSIAETKICVRVKRDTMLYLHPTDTQLEIDGGGISFGYLPVGQKVHYLRSHVHEQSGGHCQVDDDVEGVRCNGASPKVDRDRRIWWAEVWARTAGRTVRGWVPKDCLLP